MATIAPTIEVGDNWIHLTMTGSNADADTSGTLTLTDYIDWIPTRWTFVSSRTAGATDIVAVDLQGSILGIEWTDLVSQITDTEGTVTVNPVESAASSTTLNYAATGTPNVPFLVIRILVTTVGAGNTLDLHAVGVR